MGSLLKFDKSIKETLTKLESKVQILDTKMSSIKLKPKVSTTLQKSHSLPICSTITPIRKFYLNIVYFLHGYIVRLFIVCGKYI